MTKKQFSALQRILDQEAADYKIRSGRPAPGQHPSEDKVAVSDGNIGVLLDALLPELPVGERVDSFAQIIRNERESGSHLPVSAGQIKISQWRKQAQLRNGQADAPGVELTVPKSVTQLNIDPLMPGQAVSIDLLNPIVAHFNSQLLIDAAEAVGGKPIYFLGYGRFNSHFPSLLVIPPSWTAQGCVEPIALVLSLRQ